MASDREALPPWIAEMVEHARRRIPDGWTLENAPNNRNGDVLIAYLADRLDAALAAPPSAQGGWQDKVDVVRRDIALVREVAARRSDPDREHKLMITRLDQWADALYAAIRSPLLPPPAGAP